jgi:hypothetical protein
VPLVIAWLVTNATLHPVVVTMPRSAETSIEAVARYIAARAIDPIERIKALHDWVADRIAYDADAWRGDVPLDDADPEEVFRRRIGVCAGYARLLEELGRAAEIPIRTVHGMTPMGRHAWNIVAIAGRTYQIDVTWDAGIVENGRFVKRYSTDYFLFSRRADHSAYTECDPSDGFCEPDVLTRAQEWINARERRLERDAAWQQFHAAAEAERAAVNDRFWAHVRF